MSQSGRWSIIVSMSSGKVNPWRVYEMNVVEPKVVRYTPTAGQSPTPKYSLVKLYAAKL